MQRTNISTLDGGSVVLYNNITQINPRSETMAAANFTKHAIIDAFKTLVRSDGFDIVTIEQIAAKATVNRQTFYYHFADKYDLVNHIFYTALFVPFAETLDKGSVQQAFEQLFETLEQDRKFFRKIFDSKARENFANYFNALARNLLVQLSDDKIKETDITADFFANGLTGVVTSWCVDSRDISPQTMAQHTCRFARMFLQTTTFQT